MLERSFALSGLFMEWANKPGRCPGLKGFAPLVQGDVPSRHNYQNFLNSVLHRIRFDENIPQGRLYVRFSGIDIFSQGALGGLGVPGQDGFENGEMLVAADSDAFRRVDVFDPKKTESGIDILKGRENLLITEHLADPDVKLFVAAAPIQTGYHAFLGEVSVFSPLFLEGIKGAFGRTLAGQGLDHVAFQGEPEFIEFGQLVDGPAFDGAAHVGLAFDQVDLAETTQCFPHGDATHIELRANLILFQVVAGQIFPR